MFNQKMTIGWALRQWLELIAMGMHKRPALWRLC